MGDFLKGGFQTGRRRGIRNGHDDSCVITIRGGTARSQSDVGSALGAELNPCRQFLMTGRTISGGGGSNLDRG